MRSNYYWAHCKSCDDHFETKTGVCIGCRDDENVVSCDGMAERGCEDCVYIMQLEDDLARAREIIAKKKAAV